MKRLRQGVIVFGLLTIVGSIAWNINVKEETLTNGKTILLTMAPVDPRSLMQGDYMVLRYATNLFPAADVITSLPYKGFVVLALDDKRVATFARLGSDSPLSNSEVKVAYRRTSSGLRPDGIKYAAGSYFFEEGQAERFQSARYVIVSVDQSGATLITGLADENGNAISD